MGQSTNAILFYGIGFNDEGHEIDPQGFPEGTEPEDDDAWTSYSWEEAWALMHGAIRPPPVTPEENSSSAAYQVYVERNKEVLDAWWEAKRKAEEQAGCGLDTHCSSECPMLFVYLSGTHQVCWRGSVVEAHMNLPIPKEEADAKLKDFCEKMGLMYQEPKWLLVSDWS